MMLLTRLSVIQIVLLSLCFISQCVTANINETSLKSGSSFDGVIGYQGELISDAAQSLHLWKAAPLVTHDDPIAFAYRKFSGDFILTVQLKNQMIGAGLQITSDESAITFRTKQDSQQNIFVEMKTGDGKLTQLKPPPITNPDILQIEVKGTTILFSAAVFGKPLKKIAQYILPKSQIITAGIYRDFSIDNKSTLEIRNLRWVIPVWPNFVPFQDYIGSRLEILDVLTGERNVIYQTSAGIEAPNWTSDGENIIYDSSGRVYKFHLPSKKISMLNTGFEIKANNDHIISFKSKALGITHLVGDLKDNWIIFKLPINGGEPIQLTYKAPAYLHGWSPDGRYILYTSKRDGNFKLYRGASDGSDDEVQLTFGDNMDDGSEYSPDGKYIYFNSTRSGNMQIWRMDANGKNLVQITHDIFQNWFPHISPDGTQIIFLSYQPDVKPEAHLHYQQVYLRTMPVSGGEPKVVSYLYGGQGTINVPSWSPDSRYVAFVSNSQ